LHFGSPSVSGVVVVRGRLRLGAELNMREQFRAESRRRSGVAAADEWPHLLRVMPYGPTRVQFEGEKPRGFAGVQAGAGEHSPWVPSTPARLPKGASVAVSSANEMAGLTVPTLILTGDEDWPCLAPAFG